MNTVRCVPSVFGEESIVGKMMHTIFLHMHVTRGMNQNGRMECTSMHGGA